MWVTNDYTLKTKMRAETGKCLILQQENAFFMSVLFTFQRMQYKLRDLICKFHNRRASFVETFQLEWFIFQFHMH